MAALKAARKRLPPNSGMGQRLDKLVECGETLKDFEPFVQAMSGALAGLSDTGDTPPTEFPCAVAKGQLALMVGQNPGQVGAQLAGMAALISPSNATSTQLLGQLNSLSGMLLGIGLLPGALPLPASNAGGVSDFLTQQILNLYGTIINGTFYECPESGSGPFS